MKTLSITLFILLALVLTATNSIAQQNKQTAAIEIIQFHSEHRCVTCMLIEKLTRKTLVNNFPTVAFSLVNGTV
jgi:hypothetical protein